MVKNRNKISLELSNVQNEGREENYFGDSSSVCSEEASNYPEEELVSNLKETIKRRRRNSSNKHQVERNTKLSKKKGKTKLDKKMRMLQQLIPNSTNVDNNVCVLDEAIVYIKFLQNQIQFISSANAVTAGMYSSMMQTLQQLNMMNQFYASYRVQNDLFSSLPSFSGSGIQTPHAGMIFQQPSIMSNSCVPFSPYGILMASQSK